MSPEGNESKHSYPTDEELMYAAAQHMREGEDTIKHALMSAVAPHYPFDQREEKVQELLKAYTKKQD